MMDRILREEARLVILRALAEEPNHTLNSELLRRALEVFGITRTRDWVHSELQWLADVGCVTKSSAGTVWVVRLTATGTEHVERQRVVPGIKRPSPPET